MFDNTEKKRGQKESPKSKCDISVEQRNMQIENI
jgi:hypothetical protein